MARSRKYHRVFTVGAAVALLSAVAVAGGTPATSDAATLQHISMAITGSGEVKIVTDAAQQEGFFTQAGLDVSIQQLTATLAVDSVVSQQVNYDTGAGVTVDLAALKGQDIRTYGVFVQRESFVLVGKPGISTIQDLRGKTVVGSGSTSANDVLLGALLQAHGGASMVSSVNVLNQSGGSAGQIALLRAGKVDAAVVDYSDYLALPKGYPIIYNFASASSPFVGVYNGVVTTTKYAATNRAQVTAVISAMAKAAHFVATNEAKTIPLIEKDFELNAAQAKLAWKNEKDIFSPSPRPAQATINSQLAQDQKAGNLAALPLASQIYDFSYLPK
jgi:NitT/TauT family transport system substrate-binding protein